MIKWAHHAILLLGLLMMIGIVAPQLAGQTVPPPGTNHSGQNHAAIQASPACQKILTECRNLGFIQGQWRKDNGLWRDCFDPVVKGGTPTREGKAISVPVSPSDVQACRAALGHHRQRP